jgi:hypothetical protein
VACCALLWSCLAPAPGDLEGPRITRSDLERPRTVAVGVRGPWELEFSEPLDPRTVHAGSVVLVEWTELGRCDLTPVCSEGQCNAGRCEEDPLSHADLSRIDRGEYSSGLDLQLELLDGEEGLGSRLRITPLRALRAHAGHTLVLGAAIRDVGGAPLVDELELESRYRRELVTGAEGSSGPEAVLVSPRPGQHEVPTNLGRVRTRFSTPVRFDESATLVLEAEGGDSIELAGPSPCPGWAPGFCAQWELGGELGADTRYRPQAGTLQDLAGQALVPAAQETWFRTGLGPDHDPPALDKVSAYVRGRCVVVGAIADEPLRLTLRVGSGKAELEGWGPLALAVPVFDAEVGHELEWTLSAEDLAGQAGETVGSVIAGPAFGAPAIAITEVLANPAGAEPAREFVELKVLGDTSVTTAGVLLSDLPWGLIEDALDLGSEPPGDPLPAVVLDPDEVAIITGPGFAEAAGDDSDPVAGTRVLELESSLGESGLKNSGESVTLYQVSPARLLGSYGNWIATESTSHGGRSVAVVDPRGCDVAANWRSHPDGGADPGAAP